MSERFDWCDLNRAGHPAAKAFLLALTGYDRQLGTERGPDSIVKRVIDGSDHGIYEVSFTVGGIEVPFATILGLYQQAFDRCVEERAVEIIKERVAEEVTGKLEEISRAVDEGIGNACRKAFPQAFDEEG
jgi:hypothetical protein